MTARFTQGLSGRLIAIAAAVVSVALIVGAAGVAAGWGDSDDAGELVPGSLAGAPLTASIEGPEAITQTERLHGKGLGQGLDEAWIGSYGDGEITVWRSRSYEESDAEALEARMTLSIERSETPFSGLEALDYPAVEVHALNGMGQRHFYFRSGNDLFWLAAPPALADRALADLLRAVCEPASDDGSSEVSNSPSARGLLL